jgi:hypothetical protein
MRARAQASHFCANMEVSKRWLKQAASPAGAGAVPRKISSASAFLATLRAARDGNIGTDHD